MEPESVDEDITTKRVDDVLISEELVSLVVTGGNGAGLTGDMG